MQPRPLIDLVDAIPDPTIQIDTSEFDYFEDALSSLFCDARNQHGDPGQWVVYRSAKYFGRDIKLKLADPKSGETRLFAHFLWNAGVQAAEMIACGEFDVKDQTVLELGSGAALPSLVAIISKAKEVVISDYPADEIMTNITNNVSKNILPEDAAGVSITVAGHMWGDFDPVDARPPPEIPSELRHPKLPSVKGAGEFTRIIVADCMWMDWEHKNLCSSIAYYLDPKNGEVLTIAGFHTGRAKVANFFNECREAGLVLLGDGITEMNVDGGTRPWQGDRGFEDIVERKRWLAIARYKMGNSS